MDSEALSRDQLLDKIKWLQKHAEKLENRLLEQQRELENLKRNNESLSDSEAHFRELAEQLPEIVSETDVSGRLTFVNRKAFEITGYTQEDFDKGFHSLDLVHPSQRDRALNSFLQILKGKPPTSEEYLAVKKDGATFPVLVHSTPIIKDGRSAGLRAIIFDITEQKKVEALYRLVTENATDIIWQVGMNNRFEFMSPSVESLYGYTVEEAMNVKPRKMVTKESYGHILEIFNKLMSHKKDPDEESPEPVTILQECVRKDSSTFWGEYRLKLATDEHGRTIGVTGITRDVTERLKVQEALQQSEEKYRTVVENANEAIVIIQEGHLRFANTKTMEMTGYSINELLTSSLVDLIEPDDCETMVRNYNKRIQGLGPDEPYQIRIKTKDQGMAWVKVDGVAIEWEGKPAVIGFLADITQRMRAEEARLALERRLLQVQKIEAVGTLASGVAHDFNNILQVISSYVQLLLASTGRNQTDVECLREIDRAAERAAELVRRLLTFSHKMEPDLKPVNLNDRILHTVKVLERTIPKMIRISTSLADDLWTINGDPNQLEQVLMNLGSNAKDAMPDGGELCCETSNLYLGQKYYQANPDVLPGDYVQLKVSDTGLGMDEDLLSKIFEPFFTTKPVGEGTGLGLATVYGIVKSHGGHLSCESAPGEGTVFTIHLPVIAEDERDTGVVSPVRKSTGRGDETILLVDDEPAILQTSTETLQEFGYKVITAPNGEAALEIYQERRQDIQLVIMDLGMPGMGGLACLKQIREINPQASVIIASGYSLAGQSDRIREYGAKGALNKPYRLSDFLAKVREVLDDSY